VRLPNRFSGKPRGYLGKNVSICSQVIHSPNPWQKKESFGGERTLPGVKLSHLQILPGLLSGSFSETGGLYKKGRLIRLTNTL
jgi:hypothetical protein